MDMSNATSEEDALIRPRSQSHQQDAEWIPPITFCKHGRLIDNIVTKRGKFTGKVRCLECGAVIDDPYLIRK